MRHRPRVGPCFARSTWTFHPWNHERSLGHRTDPARTDVRARLSARRREAHERSLAARYATRRGGATGACDQSLKFGKRPLTTPGPSLARVRASRIASDQLERRISGIVMYLLATQETRKLLVVALVLILGSLTVGGQDGARSNRAERTNALTIVNPSEIDIPGDRARVLLLTTCRVVADEFHRKPREVELTMTLV